MGEEAKVRRWNVVGERGDDGAARFLWCAGWQRFPWQVVRQDSEVSSWSSKTAEFDFVAEILLNQSNSRRPQVAEAARWSLNETYLIYVML